MSVAETISFDCSTCHKGVGGTIDHTSWLSEEVDEYESSAAILTRCPICKKPTLLKAKREEVGPYREWYDIERVWPEPIRGLSGNGIPDPIKKDLQDALRSYSAHIFSACVVLCGRALERIVVEKTSEKTILKGLQKLQEQKVIDSRLYEWANALREQRNIGAHASDKEVTKENAGDVLDFLIAICEYIYVLTRKFEEFKNRKIDTAPEQSGKQ